MAMATKLRPFLFVFAIYGCDSPQKIDLRTNTSTAKAKTEDAAQEASSTEISLQLSLSGFGLSGDITISDLACTVSCKEVVGSSSKLSVVNYDYPQANAKDPTKLEIPLTAKEIIEYCGVSKIVKASIALDGGDPISHAFAADTNSNGFISDDGNILISAEPFIYDANTNRLTLPLTVAMRGLDIQKVIAVPDGKGGFTVKAVNQSTPPPESHSRSLRHGSSRADLRARFADTHRKRGSRYGHVDDWVWRQSLRPNNRRKLSNLSHRLSGNQLHANIRCTSRSLPNSESFGFQSNHHTLLFQ